MLNILQESVLSVLGIIGILILLSASNIVLSLFYNVKGLGEDFSRSKLKEGLLKILALVIGTLLLTVGLVTLFEYASKTGYLGDSLAEGLSVAVIVGIYGSACTYYGFQAIETLKDILID